MPGKIICWPLNGSKKKHINNTLATAKRWPRPLNTERWSLTRGIKYSSLLTNKSGLRKCPLKGRWPLNRWPLNRGQTVSLGMRRRQYS